MTIQVVIFSVMLFGAIGMVIDFGRAYSAHSQMQSYIDQVALAAAAELDGRTGAISRAAQAGEAVRKSSLFTEGGGNFTTAALVFLTAAPTGPDGGFDPGRIEGLRTDDDGRASHVLAVADTRAVRASLLELNVGSDGARIGSLPVGTIAVATARQSTCAGMTTLVMCNPFEDSSTHTLRQTLENGQGLRMKLTADAAQALSPGAGEILLGLIADPVQTMGTDSRVCDSADLSLLPGFRGDTSPVAIQQLRDECLLAVVETGLACVNDSLLVRAAPAGSVVTGLDARFDLYDDGMADILASDPPVEAGRTRRDFFTPDIAAVHGRIQRGEIPLYLAAAQAATVPNGPRPLPGATPSVGGGPSDPLLVSAYPDTVENKASRQNYVGNLANGAFGPMPRPPCLTAGACDAGPHPAITMGVNEPDAYAAAYYTPRLAALGGGGTPTGTVNVNTALLTGGAETLYAFYRRMERLDSTLWEYPASNGIPDPAVGHDHVRTLPENFLAAYPDADLSEVERRRLRVAVVACGSKVEVPVNDIREGRRWRAEVEDVIDVFMTEPPAVTGCATPFSLAEDPARAYPCPNSEVTAADLYVEYVGAVADDLAGSRSRVYAVLVH